MSLLDRVEKIAAGDGEALREAQTHYGDSWKRRGGVGAFMMLARKWDRIENRVRMEPTRFDIFHHLKIDDRPEGLIDDIRDLRRYLLLVEAECEQRAQGETK